MILSRHSQKAEKNLAPSSLGMILQYFHMLCHNQNELCTMILAAGFRVHSRLGPGLLESVYSGCLPTN